MPGNRRAGTSVSPSSSPRTMPSSTARRSPVVPDAIAVSIEPTHTVCEPGQPASVTDDTPVSTAHDHVHAVATKPRPFIEAVVRSARRDEHRRQPEHGALRRRPPERKLEQDRLSDPLRAEPLDAGGYA